MGPQKNKKIKQPPRGRAIKNRNSLAKEITTSKWRTRVVPKERPREDEKKDIKESLDE